MDAIIPDRPGSVGIFGSIGILNVGHGDTKITFDPNNPADHIRAARIVKDMLRRGYALMVEVAQTDGTKKFQRVYEFKEDTFEYVIADLDPEQAATADQEEPREQTAAPSPGETRAPRRGPGRPRLKKLPASQTRGVAIARSAGG